MNIYVLLLTQGFGELNDFEVDHISTKSFYYLSFLLVLHCLLFEWNCGCCKC